MDFQDVRISCKDCGIEFIDRAGDQRFRAEKGWTTPPVRCRDCRAKHKAKLASY